MSGNAFESAKAGRLTFKGGALATRASGVKKKKKSKNKNKDGESEGAAAAATIDVGGEASGEAIYTIDAAKKMKYEELFPVETKRFGYDPAASRAKSVEEALDDRVKKKADRYCK